MQHRKLTIWTLVANFMIVIAAGHGIATLGILEFVFIQENEFTSVREMFSSYLFLAAIVNMVGQVIVIASLLTKPNFVYYLKPIGILFLLLGFALLLSYVWSTKDVIIPIISGIPFIILTIVLLYKHFTSENASAN